jgi:NADP-reducing hydrogenase subunit HndB
MAKMTLEELRKLRTSEKQALSNRDIEGKEIQVIIGMGTCGIAAGAKDTMNSFVDTINNNGLQNITIRQTGCMGLCYAEPTVEIKMADMPPTIYGNVDAQVAKDIVENHIMHKRLVDKHVFDKPAADITQ